MRNCSAVNAVVLLLAGPWLALQSSGSAFLAAPIQATTRGDSAKLQGVWIEEYTEHGGKKVMQDGRFIFVGDRFFRLNGDQVIEEGTFTIDSSGAVKKIDYRCLKGYRNNRGTDEVLTRLAIYELDGDSLRELGAMGYGPLVQSAHSVRRRG